MLNGTDKSLMMIVGEALLHFEWDRQEFMTINKVDKPRFSKLSNINGGFIVCAVDILNF